MTVSMPDFVWARALRDAAEAGANCAMEKAGLLATHVSMTDAYKQHKRRNVDRWVKEGKIKPIRLSGNATKRFLVRAELEVLEKSFNRPVYNLITTSH